MKKTFYTALFGCDKNRVDGERILGEIRAHGCDVTDDPREAEVIVVNTCAFLNSAREESINAVIEANGLRGGKLEKLVVTGCLPEKYVKELYPALTEADVFLGVKDADELFPALERAYAGERVNAVGTGTGKRGERAVSTPSHIKYLKIADGCFNRCTYCLIPKIRGKYVSYPLGELVEEARSLGKTEELVLVAQDTTRYGEDRGQNEFVKLIEKISELDNICHIRLLYCYPEAVTEELISEIRDNPKVLKYIDLPMQHCEDRILKLMGRRSDREKLVSLIKRLREEVPGIAIRSTFISGFPSETEEEHRALISFLREEKLENCGFFAYSREPDTPAYRMKGQIHPMTKKRRVRELYEVQAEISSEKLKSYLGKTLSVLTDGREGDGYLGRAYFQAAEIDGTVWFSSENEVSPGEIVPVRILTAGEYDLGGKREE